MDLDYPVHEDRSHLLVDVDLPRHVERLGLVLRLLFKQVGGDAAHILGAGLGVVDVFLVKF